VQVRKQEDTRRLTPHPNQRSHMMSGVTGSNGFIIIPPETDVLPEGNKVTVYLFPWQGILK